MSRGKQVLLVREPENATDFGRLQLAACGEGGGASLTPHRFFGVWPVQIAEVMV